MHELFLTAIVPDARVAGTLRILQGLCGMTPVHKLERILVFEGPKSNPLVGLGGAQLQGRRPTSIPVFRELHEQLVRMSYYITLSYDITKSNFQIQGAHDTNGEDEKRNHDVEEARGNLHFVDWPDPPKASKPVNSRLAVHIRDEPRLPALLNSIRYTYRSEQVRETYNAYRENIIFSLTRDLIRPNQQTGSDEIPNSLPPFEEYQPFDGENKWTLTATVEVSDEKQGVLMQKGIEALQQVQTDLEGICEFEVVPRRQLDTRVPAYIQSMRG